MGVTKFTQEIVVPVAPARIFKALIVDSHNLLPKLVPQSMESIELVGGDGGAGTIKITKFAQGGHFKLLKHRIDVLDTENLYCKNTLIEGDVLFDKIDSVVYESKFEASGDGGCVCKLTSEYHAKDGVELKEEDIKEGKDKAAGLFKVVEAYLVENPTAYA